MKWYLYVVATVLCVSGQGVGVTVCVVDGDTFDASNGERVRVLNIDTPELGTPAGKKAYYYARRLLRGKGVTLVPEGNATGKYGRHLYHVILPDGSNFAERMIARGHSRYVVKYGRSSLYGDLFGEAEREARRYKRGIWEVTTTYDPVSPCDG